VSAARAADLALASRHLDRPRGLFGDAAGLRQIRASRGFATWRCPAASGGAVPGLRSAQPFHGADRLGGRAAALESPEGGLNGAPVDRLVGAAGTLEELSERFKTDNALLRNWLSYVGLLSTNPDFLERNPLLAKSIDALAAAILQLTLDSSALSRQAVQNRIVELGEQTPVEGPDERSAQAFIVHARLLEIVVSTVSDTLKALFAVPTRAPLEETRALFSDRHMAAEASAQRFRLFLFATSLLLLAALIDLGRRLRAQAIALRKRAAFEHLIAETSTSLINCPPGEIDSKLAQALGELGRAMGVDRAYVTLAETPVRVYGSPYPSGWPEAA